MGEQTEIFTYLNKELSTKSSVIGVCGNLFHHETFMLPNLKCDTSKESRVCSGVCSSIQKRNQQIQIASTHLPNGHA